MLVRLLFRLRVVVQYVVIGVLHLLPRQRHRCQQPLLSNPQQTPIHRIIDIHAEELRIILNLIIMRHAIPLSHRSPRRLLLLIVLLVLVVFC